MVLPVSSVDILFQWENRSGYWTLVAYKGGQLNQSAGTEVATLQPSGALTLQDIPASLGLPMNGNKWQVS